MAAHAHLQYMESQDKAQAQTFEIWTVQDSMPSGKVTDLGASAVSVAKGYIRICL